jgi:hypothetical protein
MKITYTSIDGVRKTRSFKTSQAARRFAIKMVGPQDAEGGDYAVSADGVGKVTWSGVTRAHLFGTAPSHMAAINSGLNKETTFYSRGNELFCREAGYTHDHVGQLFGRIVEVKDNVTGDHFAGYALREVDSRGLFDEGTVFTTREAAMASAKQAMLDYLNYLNNAEAGI